jgi:hypothetical protein
MVEEQHMVGLVLERSRGSGPWAEWHWLPVAVLPVPPETAPWTRLRAGAERERYYAGAYPVTLYSTETANYLENLATGAPKLWVVLRAVLPDPPIEVTVVTADPSEGEAFTESGLDSAVVNTVAMPPEIAAAVAAFAEAHHVERDFTKRKRDRRDPAMMGRGPGGGRGGRR